MDFVEIKYLKNRPEYQTKHAAGADICADISEDIILKPFERALVPTGIFLEIPEGYEAQVRPRSGLAAKFGVTVLNSPGTIDSDYRGEIKVILINLGSDDFVIHNNDRVAQMIIAPIVQGNFKKDEFLTNTDRGHGGFGSTGF